MWQILNWERLERLGCENTSYFDCYRQQMGFRLVFNNIMYEYIWVGLNHCVRFYVLSEPNCKKQLLQSLLSTSWNSSQKTLQLCMLMCFWLKTRSLGGTCHRNWLLSTVASDVECMLSTCAEQTSVMRRGRWNPCRLFKPRAKGSSYGMVAVEGCR